MSSLMSRLYNWATDKANNIKIIAARMDAEMNQVIVSLNRKVLCSASAPVSPISGQTWVDTTNKVLKLYRNGEWVIQGVVHVGAAAMATPQAGDLWFNTTNNYISAYTGTTWQGIGGLTGEITMWFTPTAPAGALLCDGAAVSRTTYAALFAVIGEVGGVGDGTTTFNVPNIKHRVPVGYDADETEFNALGKTSGAKTHTLTTDEMPAHTHIQKMNDSSGGSSNMITYVIQGGSTNSDTQTAPAGGGAAHNNLQPGFALNFIIKT